jgi:GDP-4-dehydro-6-deoxy-D-mannose reductase
MRALVTGACGFVGNYLIGHLLEQGDTVLGTILRERDDRAPLDTTGAQYERLDLRDRERVAAAIEAFDPEVVYHLAGLSFVPEAEEHFDLALLTNVGCTEILLRALAKRSTPATFVFVSSAEVYGKITPADLPLTEGTHPRPANNYSLTKLMSEHVVERFAREGRVRTVIARPFNHTGPGQGMRFVVSSFAYQLALVAKGKMPPVLEVGNLDPKRDFSDVRDIVRAYRLAATHGSGTFNFGSGRAVAVQEVLDRLLRVSGLSVDIRVDPRRVRPVEVPELFGSYAAAERAFGWRPEIPLEQTLEDVYRYWYDFV